MSLVLVTGFGGFLGAEVCRQLLKAGHQVRGLARRAYPHLAELGVEAIQGDAVDRETCERATQQVDAVVHTAAIAGVWGPRERFESINVKATENLLQASHDNGVRAFVYSSSPSVTFDGQPQSGVDESVPYPTQWLCDYPRTKALAEQRVLGANQPGRFGTCALRPHLIWGPGDPHLLPRLLDRCRKGKLMCVGSGKNLIDTVHVEAAAAAHVLAVDHLLSGNQAAGGKAYFVTDGDPIECWSWISMLLRHHGLEPPRKRIPLAIAYRLGHLLELVYRVLGKQDEPPMTRFVAAQLGVDHYFSIEAIRRDLGFRGIEQTSGGSRQAMLERM